MSHAFLSTAAIEAGTVEVLREFEGRDLVIGAIGARYIATAVLEAAHDHIVAAEVSAASRVNEYMNR